MTDGPFKNPKLAKYWGRLAEAVQNDAASPAECAAFASDALTRQLVTNEHAKALRELDAHLGSRQMEFDPLGPIEAIFDRCERTPFLDAFQKELLFRAASDTPLADAVAPALDAAIKNQIGETRSRFQEEFIRAREMGEITTNVHDRAHEKINLAFDSVETWKVRDALVEGKKDAFDKDLGKSDSVDEGMVRL